MVGLVSDETTELSLPALAVPLTEAEMRRKEELESKGFSEWTRRDFQQFIKGMEKHGR